jgi:hypothetical protein
LLIAFGFLNLNSSVYASEATEVLVDTATEVLSLDSVITLPAAEILEERITNAIGTPHFLEKTKLHTQLGSTSKPILGHNNLYSAYML